MVKPIPLYRIPPDLSPQRAIVGVTKDGGRQKPEQDHSAFQKQSKREETPKEVESSSKDGEAIGQKINVTA